MPVPNASQAQLAQMRRRNESAGAGLGQMFQQLMAPMERGSLRGTWDRSRPSLPATAAVSAGGDWRKNPDGSPRIGNAATADLIAGQNAAIKAYDTPAPGLTAPAPQVTPAVRARREAVTTMAQQYAPQDFWKRENAQALVDLASKSQAPAEAKLADYYAAQSAAGSGNMGEIVTGLTAGLDGQRAEAMKAWAQANPMLAFREYSRRQSKGLLGDATPQVDQLAITPEQRAAAEGGYGGAKLDPAAMAGAGPLTAETLVNDARFKNPEFTAEQPISAPAPGVPTLSNDLDTRQLAERGYGGTAERNAFEGAAGLRNTAFVGGGLQRDQALIADTAQAVPTVAEPFLEPGEMRASNLSGNEALMQARGPQAAAADQLLLQHLQKSRGLQGNVLVAQGVK